MLYTLLQSPWQCDIDSLLLLMQEGDDLLLLQDGVTAALEGSQMFIKLSASPATLWYCRKMWSRVDSLSKFQPK